MTWKISSAQLFSFESTQIQEQLQIFDALFSTSVINHHAHTRTHKHTHFQPQLGAVYFHLFR